MNIVVYGGVSRRLVLYVEIQMDSKKILSEATTKELEVLTKIVQLVTMRRGVSKQKWMEEIIRRASLDRPPGMDDLNTLYLFALDALCAWFLETLKDDLKKIAIDSLIFDIKWHKSRFFFQDPVIQKFYEKSNYYII